MNENIFPLKVSSLRQDKLYWGMTNLCQNTRFTFKIPQCTGVNQLVDTVQWFFPQLFNKGIISIQCTKVHPYFVCS